MLYSQLVATVNQGTGQTNTGGKPSIDRDGALTAYKVSNARKNASYT